MDSRSKDQSFQEALDTCAAEPVHIPGIVQPFACLIAVHADTCRIEYASENCGAILGIDTSDLLGSDLDVHFGGSFQHALNNAIARNDFSVKVNSIGQFPFAGTDLDVSAFGSNGQIVMQFEPLKDPGLGSEDSLGTLTFLMNEIQTCKTEEAFFALTTNLLRHLSGYDRVMIYKFDTQYNGEVLAEARKRGMEPFVGLRFPQWDIPAQAREIMRKLPLRFIADVDQTPVPLRSSEATLPPLDITLAESRGVSMVHMEYLRNMGSQATMTLSVVVDGALWGIISFHHQRPRVPSQKLRDVLRAFLTLFSTKVTALRKEAQLKLVRKIDRIKNSLLAEIEEEAALDGAMPRVGTFITSVLHAEGVAVRTDGQSIIYGRVPEPRLLQHLFDEAAAGDDRYLAIENLSERYPAYENDMNGCAGVLAATIADDRAICVFRAAAVQSVAWAGNPEKTIEDVNGTARLAPRGSFSTYLQDIEGCSTPWTDEDIYFAERVWILIKSAERRALKNRLSRQQTLMIDELNHRVRNILALVRSVSRQAQRHEGSLESYSAALESRIQALAAAHDIASASSATSANIKRLIHVETEPYQRDDRIRIEGPTSFVRADIAPIFSLVIHELATNAAKYGALSSDEGRVCVTLAHSGGGLSIKWRETGGPPVTPPNARGFGSALIEQAVPHEMGGDAELRYARDGLEADLFLPFDVLDSGSDVPSDQMTIERAAMVAPLERPFDPQAFGGFTLVLEDNFVIANDMKDQLETSGVESIEICGSAEDALEILAEEAPGFAILDVNLGPGQTSEAVARALMQKGVPFVFVTGYGVKAAIAEEFNHVPRLTKPVATSDLKAAMMEMLDKTMAGVVGQ